MDQGTASRTRPWLAVGQEITALLARIDAGAFAAVADAFGDDRRWFFSGQGRSGLAAQMAAMRFMHLGRNVHFVGEVTAPSLRKRRICASSICMFRCPQAPGARSARLASRARNVSIGLEALLSRADIS